MPEHGNARGGSAAGAKDVPDVITHQAEALAAYLAKPGNRGATFWLDSKEFASGDRAAILLELSDREAIKASAVERRPA